MLMMDLPLFDMLMMDLPLFPMLLMVLLPHVNDGSPPLHVNDGSLPPPPC